MKQRRMNQRKLLQWQNSSNKHDLEKVEEFKKKYPEFIYHHYKAISINSQKKFIKRKFQIIWDNHYQNEINKIIKKKLKENNDLIKEDKDIIHSDWDIETYAILKRCKGDDIRKFYREYSRFDMQSINIFRSNSAWLNDRKFKYGIRNTNKCDHCGAVEDLPHYILHCRKYKDFRIPIMNHLAVLDGDKNVDINKWSDNKKLQYILFPSSTPTSIFRNKIKMIRKLITFIKLSKRFCINPLLNELKSFNIIY